MKSSVLTAEEFTNQTSITAGVTVAGKSTKGHSGGLTLKEMSGLMDRVFGMNWKEKPEVILLSKKQAKKLQKLIGKPSKYICSFQRRCVRECDTDEKTDGGRNLSMP